VDVWVGIDGGAPGGGRFLQQPSDAGELVRDLGGRVAALEVPMMGAVVLDDLVTIGLLEQIRFLKASSHHEAAMYNNNQ